MVRPNDNMAKLYATLETSRGKAVSISDNEQITATVYDGNMKAYSVIIEWCNVGDPVHIKCNNCDWEGDEQELKVQEGIELCPDCGLNSEGKLMDTEPTMGAIVTTREWRNREKTDDKFFKCTHTKSGSTCPKHKGCIYCDCECARKL